jgi:hypothetical protein
MCLHVDLKKIDAMMKHDESMSKFEKLLMGVSRFLFHLQYTILLCKITSTEQPLYGYWLSVCVTLRISHLLWDVTKFQVKSRQFRSMPKTYGS